ncbi:acetyltransferase [Lacticaseibacillus paracasei]|nr:acetyltransferase [Lacticaseibacillus paracasei]
MAQYPAHKDLRRNDPSSVITPEAAYAPVTKRASSRSSHQWSSAIVLLNATNRCD